MIGLRRKQDFGFYFGSANTNTISRCCHVASLPSALSGDHAMQLRSQLHRALQQQSSVVEQDYNSFVEC